MPQWTNHVSFPGIYTVSNSFIVIWLLGQLDGPSVTNSLFYLGVLLEPSSPSHLERERRRKTDLYGGALAHPIWLILAIHAKLVP